MSFGISFDLGGEAHTDDRCRINLAFERCGWESFGGTSLRYVGAGGLDNVFDEVLPPLWYMRSLLAAKDINLKSYLFTADAETYFRREGSIGHPISPIDDLYLHPSRKRRSTQNKLSENCYRGILSASESMMH